MAPIDMTAATVSLGQTVTAFTFFLPKISDVRSSDDPQTRGDVRLGELAAVTVSLGIAFMISNMTGSFSPVMVAVLVGGIVVGLYELALNTERLFENG